MPLMTINDNINNYRRADSLLGDTFNCQLSTINCQLIKFHKLPRIPYRLEVAQKLIV